MALEKVLALDASGIVEKTIVTGAGVDGVVVKHAITLTSGQTTVAVPGGYGAAGVIVFLNGAYLSPAEYTATTSPDIVLAAGAPSTGSVLDVLVLVSDGLASLGTAAFADLITSLVDSTVGRVLTTGAHNLGVGQFAKNKIINGDFRVWQRGPGPFTVVAGALNYTADRWAILAAGANIAAQQSAVGIAGKKTLRLIGAAGNTYAAVTQRIEALNTEMEQGKTVTLSVDVYSPEARTVVLALLTPATKDNFSSSLTSFASLSTVVSAGVVQRVTVTGVMPAGCANGVVLYIEPGALASGHNFHIANAQLEVGSVATPFEHRPYSLELALCQRYLPVFSGNEPISGGWCAHVTTMLAEIKLPVTARVPPTGFIVSDPSHFVVFSPVGSTIAVTGFGISGLGSNSARLSVIVADGLASGQASGLTGTTSLAKIIFTGCEL